MTDDELTRLRAAALIHNFRHGHTVLRQGRHIGRTLYATPGNNPDGDGDLIGVMDTPELAALVVAAVNALPTSITKDVTA